MVVTKSISTLTILLQKVIFTILQWSAGCDFERRHCRQIHPSQLLLPGVRSSWQHDDDDGDDAYDDNDADAEADDDDDHLGS